MSFTYVLRCQICDKPSPAARLLVQTDRGERISVAGQLCEACIPTALVVVLADDTGVFQLEALEPPGTLAMGVYNREPTAEEASKKTLIERGQHGA